jgi:hypothetical protein
MQATENQDSTSKPVAEVKTELRAKELQTRDTNFEKAPQIRP